LLRRTKLLFLAKIIPKLVIIDFMEIDDVIVNNDIFDTKFTCDLAKCKGACCTMESDYGAPVTRLEIDKIEKILDVVKKNLPKEHVKAIEKEGYWEEKFGQLLTKSVDKKSCVFVYFDGDIAKCGIEKAYREGKTDFIKPLSCHLFPIRVSDLGGPILRYEEYSECQPALEKGNKTKLSIFEFCKEALERKFNKSWIQKVIYKTKE
jgi:hypothetical protein